MPSILPSRRIADSAEALLQQRLIESRQRYKELAELAADFAWETDAGGCFTFVSPGGALGWPAQDLVGRKAGDLVGEPEEGAAAIFSARRTIHDVELLFRQPDGAAEWLQVHATPLLGEAGEWRGARGLCRRITAARRRERATALRAMQDRLAAHLMQTAAAEADPLRALAAALASTGLALGAAGAAAFRRGPAGAPLAAAEWGGAATAAIAARAAALLVPGAAEPAADDLLSAATRCGGAVNGAVILWGGAFAAEDRLTLAATAELFGAVIERLGRHEETFAAARTDPVTGLPNRRGFTEEAERRLARCAATGASGILAYLDLDNFKLVNDRRGHAAGDEALARVARVLRDNLRGGDLVARFGGDEFVAWLDGIEEEVAAERLKRLSAACDALAGLTGDPARPLGVSLGLAAWRPGRGEGLEALLARADAAMYRAKESGGGVAVAPPAGEASRCEAGG